MGILDRLRAQVAPTAESSFQARRIESYAAAPGKPRCQQGILVNGELARCTNPGVLHVPVHPTREVLVCEMHNDPERLRGATHVIAYPNHEQPDVVVVLGTYGDPT